MATQLTPNFSLEEMCASSTAKAKHIDNTPPPHVVVNLVYLCLYILQPLRNHTKKPVHVNSGYRCPELNKAVGGVSNSQHEKGEAVDIHLSGNKKEDDAMFAWMRDNLPYDQLIMEHNKSGVYWIHVSYKADGSNRHKVITNLEKK